MKKFIGKVTEVFIPKDYKNNNKIDVMDSNKIGFKILIDDEIYELIDRQDEITKSILKGDLVVITVVKIGNKEFTSIEKFDGEKDE